MYPFYPQVIAGCCVGISSTNQNWRRTLFHILHSYWTIWQTHPCERDIFKIKKILQRKSFWITAKKSKENIFFFLKYFIFGNLFNTLIIKNKLLKNDMQIFLHLKFLLFQSKEFLFVLFSFSQNILKDIKNILFRYEIG